MRRLLAASLGALLIAGCAIPPPPVRPVTPAPFVPQPVVRDVPCDPLCIRRLSSAELPRWRMLELDLETPIQVANPFDPQQIDLSVRFTAPSGQVIDVPAFFYRHADAQGWKARLTPTQEGTWRAQAIMRAPRAFEGDTVTFRVLPAQPGARGFLRVHPQNPRYLAHDDGKTFFAIGLNLAWWRDDPIEDYRRWFDALSAQGGNAVRIWMAPQSFSLEWRETPLGDYSARLARAEYLDRIFEMAEARGIYIVLVLLDYSQFSQSVYPLWHENPYNAANGGPCRRPRDFATDPTARALFKRRLRYIAARWAYSTHLLAWEWWNEVNFTELVDAAVLKPWLEEMTAVLRAYDPYRHLTTISYAVPGDPRIWAMPEIDLVQRHEYGPEEPAWFRPVAGGQAFFRHMRDIPAKPVLLGEFGAAFTYEQADALAREGVHFHNSLWAAAFNGFASTAMYWWWDTLVAPANLWPRYRGLARFLRDEDLARFAPLPVSVAPAEAAIALGLRAPDRALIWLRDRRYRMDEAAYQYSVQIATGQASEATFRFTLPALTDVVLEMQALGAGRHRVTWFDTRAGEPIAADDAWPEAGRLRLRAPAFRHDLAAKVIPLTR